MSRKFNRTLQINSKVLENHREPETLQYLGRKLVRHTPRLMPRLGVEVLPLSWSSRRVREKRKCHMIPPKEQLDNLFSQLVACLKKYRPGEEISFYWLFDSNEQLAAFEADPRFKELCGDCEKEKAVQAKTMKPVFKWLVKIPSNVKPATP